MNKVMTSQPLLLARMALITIVLSLSLSVSIVDAATFTRSPGMDMPGMDISSIDTLNVGSEQNEQQLCQRNCDLNPRCMAFTWVRRGVQGPSAKCWFKASSRIFPGGGANLVSNVNTLTGVKTYSRTACWARHIFNLKFCDVFVAVAIGDPLTSTLGCPQGSRPASISSRAQPGRFDRFCVVLRANTPNLPNCTDAFGGESHEANILGNSVNQACLDAP